MELSSRPPEILSLGASVSQAVKCFSVRQRLMSVRISAISLIDGTLRGMDQHLIEELLEVRVSFVGCVVREYIEQASLKIT